MVYLMITCVLLRERERERERERGISYGIVSFRFLRNVAFSRLSVLLVMQTREKLNEGKNQSRNGKSQWALHL